MDAAEEPATNGGRILAWSFVALALILELNAVLKGTLQAAGLNFDFVLVAAAGLGALGVVAALARPSTLGGLRVVAPPLAAFVAYMALSATWSDGYFVELPDAFVRVFGPQIGFPVFKILDFTAGCVVPLVGAAVVTAAAPRAGAYLFLAYGAIVVALLPYLVGHVVATEEVITETGVAIGVVQGVSYIQFGLYVGKMIVAAMVAVLTLRLGPVIAAPALLLAAGGYYLILVTGSTQVTVGVAIVAVAIVAVWTLRLRASGRHFAFLTMATAFALAGVALVTVSLLEAALGFDDLRAIERLLGKLEEGVYFAGTSGRQELHAAAIDGWSRSPVFGIGIGGYPSLLTNLPRDYPHNIVLEILCELGVVGLALFLWGVRAVWGHFRTALRLRTFAADIAVFTSVLYALSALASGSLNDHRILFLHVGVVIGLSYAAGRAAEQAETAAPAAPSPAPPPVAAGGA